MRILQVSDFYPPIVGGLERHVQTLAHTLAARKHDVAVATLWREGSPAFEDDRGVRVHVTGPMSFPTFRTPSARIRQLPGKPE